MPGCVRPLGKRALLALVVVAIPAGAAAQPRIAPFPSAPDEAEQVTFVLENPEDERPLTPLLPLDADRSIRDRIDPPVTAKLTEAEVEVARQASPAAAAADQHPSLPEPVRAMIDAAIESQEEATVRAVLALAHKTNPDSGDEIEAIKLAYEGRLAIERTERQASKIEAIRTAGMLENWDGRGELGGFQSTGNANVIGVTAALSLNKVGYNWRHRFNGRVDYQESNGLVGREQYLATYEPNRRLSEHLFVFGFGQYESDRFQGFSNRYTLASGLRYELVDDGTITLSAKAGPAWRGVNFIDGTSLNELAALGAFDLNWKIAENITLTNNSNIILQPSNSTLVSQSGAIAKVASKLSVRLSYTVEYNTEPPIGSVGTDTLSRVTLIYDF